MPRVILNLRGLLVTLVVAKQFYDAASAVDFMCRYYVWRTKQEAVMAHVTTAGVCTCV